MRRLILILANVFLIAIVANADPKITVPNAVWDFGFIPQHGSFSHDYLIINAGDDTLRIVKVKSSCGCTTAPIRKEVLTPGESTFVELVFNSGSYRANVSKYATIYSNDPVNPTSKIFFAADVYSTTDSTLPFEVLPDKITLSRSDSKSVVVLENKSDSEMLVGDRGPRIEGLSLGIENTSLEPGEKGTLRLKWDGDFQKENQEKTASFVISYNNGKEIKISVPVTIQGTDPTPPKTAGRKTKPAAGQTAGTGGGK